MAVETRLDARCKSRFFSFVCHDVFPIPTHRPIHCPSPLPGSSSHPTSLPAAGNHVVDKKKRWVINEDELPNEHSACVRLRENLWLNDKCTPAIGAPMIVVWSLL